VSLVEKAKEIDQQVGQVVASLRGDMSQQAVADKMRDAGFAWSQATVWSVESGKRPLKLSEARQLSQLFRTSLASFFEPPVDVRKRNNMSQFNERCLRAYHDAVTAMTTFIEAREQLEHARKHSAKDDPNVYSLLDGRSNLLDQVDDTLKKTPELVLRRGRYEVESNKKGEDQAMEIMAEYGSIENYLIDEIEPD